MYCAAGDAAALCIASSSGPIARSLPVLAGATPSFLQCFFVFFFLLLSLPVLSGFATSTPTTLLLAALCAPIVVLLAVGLPSPPPGASVRLPLCRRWDPLRLAGPPAWLAGSILLFHFFLARSDRYHVPACARWMTWFSGLQYCSWTAALMDAYIASLDI